jgi:HK97 family phage prohead protease
VIPLITGKQFRSLVRAKKHTDGVMVAKQSSTPVEIGRGSRMLRFTISTATKDREGDTVSLSGWRLQNYARNPVVLLNHDSENFPIGRAHDVRVEGGALKATVEFVPASVPIAGERAEAAYQLCTSGFMAATSVGFRPIDWAFPDDRDGVDFVNQELCEFSIVCIPCNPEAVIDPASAARPVAASYRPGRASSSANSASAKRRRQMIIDTLLLSS